MRRFHAPSLVRRTVLALVIAALAVAFAVPVIAGAATKPTVSIKASVTTLANAAPFTWGGLSVPLM